MASVANYGGFAFQDNEVNLVSVNKRNILSPRNRRLQTVINLTCQGEALPSAGSSTPVSEIISRIASIESALRFDGGNFSYTVGGTTAHTLNNDADCISKVRVIQRSFPKGDGAELIAKRTFSFTLQATYDSKEDDLVSWQETITIVGTGGPRWFILENATDIPLAIVTANKTAQLIHQDGMAVGYSDYPEIPGANVRSEFEPARRIVYLSARQMGDKLKFYPVRWHYQGAHDPSSFGQLDIKPTSK